jgi:hypothetical protein
MDVPASWEPAGRGVTATSPHLSVDERARLDEMVLKVLGVSFDKQPDGGRYADPAEFLQDHCRRHRYVVQGNEAGITPRWTIGIVTADTAPFTVRVVYIPGRPYPPAP